MIIYFLLSFVEHNNLNAFGFGSLGIFIRPKFDRASRNTTMEEDIFEEIVNIVFFPRCILK